MKCQNEIDQGRRRKRPARRMDADAVKELTAGKGPGRRQGAGRVSVEEAEAQKGGCESVRS